jgi:hypothetical protein
MTTPIVATHAIRARIDSGRVMDRDKGRRRPIG